MSDNNSLTIPAELHTLQDFVRWGSSQLRASGVFFGHGNDDAIDEAMALLLHSVDLEPGIPDNFWAANLTLEEKQLFMQLLERRIVDRIPMPYITGTAWFAGLAFHVDERVLIPRSPFAELIGQAFAPWVNAEEVMTVLELGTGSGCMGIATAMHLPHVHVDAVDISSDALSVAAQNVAAYDLEERLQLILGDLFEPLSQERYDLIISNPPYVDADEMATLPEEYRHEPELALAAGDDGLDIAHRILAQAANYLTPQGILIVEVGDSAPALTHAYPDVDFIWPNFEHGGSGVFILNYQQLCELNQNSPIHHETAS